MKKPTSKPKKPRDPSTLLIKRPEAEDEGKVIAETFSKPEVRAAQTIQRFEGDLLDVTCLAAELSHQTKAIQTGDMNRLEAMLAAQAHTLDALFSQMTARAHKNMMGGYLDAANTYMKLGLKAQAQTVKTVEALGELKYPKTVSFIGQANIASGHQQVNNGIGSHAHEKQIEQTKLSDGGRNELRENTRTSSIAGETNTPMEAVGTLHGAQNR